MIKTDFHIHTTISVDASGQIDDMVKRAIELGLTEIAITDHADYNPLDEGANLYVAADAYKQTLDAIERFGDQIIIRHGVELGEPHMFEDEIKPVRQIPLDVIIGSVHFIGEHGVHADYFDVFELRQGITDFFDFTLDMIRSVDIDILAHLDYFERYTTQRGHEPYNPLDYKDQIYAILRTLIDRNIALEVNTSGYRLSEPRSFPHPMVLGWFHELGGKLISIGSDAHQPNQLAFGFEDVARKLLDSGFTQYYTFENRNAIARDLLAD